MDCRLVTVGRFEVVSPPQIQAEILILIETDGSRSNADYRFRAVLPPLILLSYSLPGFQTLAMGMGLGKECMLFSALHCRITKYHPTSTCQPCAKAVLHLSIIHRPIGE